MQDPVSFADGRFKVIRLLGEGGMAFAYLCLDRHLRRPVAIKVPRPNLANQRWVSGRFAQEVGTQARATHPNVVTLHDAGIERSPDGSLTPYLVMEYVGGVSLKDCFHPGRNGTYGALPPSVAARVVLAVLSAVAAMHGEGIIHRDINPNNVMLGWNPDVVKLMDFGVARIAREELDDGDRQTKTSFLVVSRGYTAPEQILSFKNADHRADVYSVGATLYAMLAGIEPDDLFIPTIDEPEFLLVPERLRSVVFGATRYRPEERAYQSAADMAAAVREAMRDIPVEEDAFHHWLAARREASDVEEAIRRAIEQENAPPEEDAADGYTRWFFADHDRQSDVPDPPTPSEPVAPAAPVSATPPRNRYRAPGLILLSGAMIAALVAGIGSWSKRDASDLIVPTPGVGSQDYQHPVLVPAVEDPKAVPVAPSPEDPLKPTTGGKRSVAQVRPLPIVDPASPLDIVSPPPVVEVALPPDPVPETPSGTVRFTGGATSIVLIGADGTRHNPGNPDNPSRIPPGTYRIEATFEGKGVVENAGNVNVLPDETKTLACKEAFSICR